MAEQQQDLQPHIWLRYATEFNQEGRKHTLEIGIPVPIGASSEERARLIQEAQAGMDQLSGQVEQQISRLQQQRANRSAPPAQTTRPVNGSASTATPQAPRVQPPPVSQPPQVAQNRTRQLANGDENALRAQFLAQAKEKLGLTPRQVMETLNVKTLSGLNFQEAYEQLTQAGNKSTPVGKPVAPPPTPAPQISQETPAHKEEAHNPVATPSEQPVSSPAPIIREQPRFEEEDEEDEDLPDFTDLDDEDEEEEMPGLVANELRGEGRDRVRSRLAQLRSIQGKDKVSKERTSVLKNVTHELDSEERRTLIQGIWGPDATRTLRVEQAEALISWGKEDDFSKEAQEMLKILAEEKEYASSDR